MPALMSVSMTEDAVLARTKDVTRRIGWRNVKVGQRLTLCRKVMGRRKPDGSVEPLVRLVDVEVVSERWERLNLMIRLPLYGAREVAREGFPGMDPEEFVRRYFTEAQGIQPDAHVHRIEWRYLG